MVKIREFAFLVLVLEFGALESTVRHERHLLDNAIPGRLENEHRIMLECQSQNPDYRTYIKCLKREKRQFQHLDGCIDECFKKDCQNSTCLRDCHASCKSRRLIETYIKTVETNLDCQNSTCSKNNNNNAAPNITTNIHIENVLPNITSSGTDTDVKNVTDNNNTSYIVPKVDINNIINNQFGLPGSYPPGSCPYGNGCNYYQNYQPLLPQITIGFGGGPVGGGCMYPPWPCLSRNPNILDCSPCSNPFLRYQCDVRCYSDPQNNKNNSTTTQRPSSVQTGSRNRNGI